MAKATHAGHCQICGALQLLPSGQLSIHGYTVSHGYFSGVCTGSKHQPFEKSTDLIVDAISRAKKHRTHVKARQAELRQKATEPKGWVSFYIPATWSYRHSRTEWRQVEIRREVRTVTYRPEPVVDFVYDGEKDGKVRREVIDGYGISRWMNFDEKKEATVLDVATMCNTGLANALQSEVDNLTRYIKWQEDRIANWKEQDCLPLKSKDKTSAFVPVAVPEIAEAKGA